MNVCKEEDIDPKNHNTDDPFINYNNPTDETIFSKEKTDIIENWIDIKDAWLLNGSKLDNILLKETDCPWFVANSLPPSKYVNIFKLYVFFC